MRKKSTETADFSSAPSSKRGQTGKKLSKYDIRYRVCNSSESTRGSTLTQNFTDMASLRSPTEVGEDGTDFSMLSDLAFFRSQSQTWAVPRATPRTAHLFRPRPRTCFRAFGLRFFSIPESNLGRSACYPAYGPPFSAEAAHTFPCFLTRNFSKSFRGLSFFCELGPVRTRCRVGRHSFHILHSMPCGSA
jgi:hypothetical protein